MASLADLNKKVSGLLQTISGGSSGVSQQPVPNQSFAPPNQSFNTPTTQPLQSFQPPTLEETIQSNQFKTPVETFQSFQPFQAQAIPDVSSKVTQLLQEQPNQSFQPEQPKQKGVVATFFDDAITALQNTPEAQEVQAEPNSVKRFFKGIEAEGKLIKRGLLSAGDAIANTEFGQSYADRVEEINDLPILQGAVENVKFGAELAGKGAVWVGKETAAGLSTIGKSVLEAFYGEEAIDIASDPEFEKKFLGRETNTVQDFSRSVKDFLATQPNATTFEKIALPPLAGLGLFVLENPLGAPIKKVSKTLIETIANSSDGVFIKEQLVKNFPNVKADNIDDLAALLAKETDQVRTKSLLETVGLLDEAITKGDQPLKKKITNLLDDVEPKKAVAEVDDQVARLLDDEGFVSNKIVKEVVEETPVEKALVKEAKKPSLKPFDEIARETGEIKEAAFDMRPTQRIDISDLHAHGDDEFSDALRNVRKGNLTESVGEPVVVTQNPNGKVIIADGHHRVAQALLEGNKDIEVSFINFDEITGKFDPDFVFPSQPIAGLIDGGEGSAVTDLSRSILDDVSKQATKDAESLVSPQKTAQQKSQALVQVEKVTGPPVQKNSLSSSQEILRPNPELVNTPPPKVVSEANINLFEDNVPPGGIHKIRPESIKDVQANKEEFRNLIASRTTKGGNESLAIRKDSGVYAPREFNEFQFKDIDRGLALNLNDAAFAFDNLTVEQAAKQGWGPMARINYQVQANIAESMDYLKEQALKVRDVSKKHNIKINKETGDQLFRALEGKTDVPANVLALSKDVRIILDEARLAANKVRKSMGKTEIGFIKNYAPHVEETNFWRNLINDARTEITDNFDYIIPNAKKNPHALRRTGAKMDLNTNMWELLEGYFGSISDDMFSAPSIEQLKIVGTVLDSEGYTAMSSFINKVIRENIAGKPATLDNFFGFVPGTKKRAIANSVNRARNVASLAGNLVWTVFVQPASTVLTAARAGGITRGAQNTLGGMWDFATNKTLRNEIKTLPTTRIKTKSSIGKTGAGDIDRLGAQIVRSKIDTVNDYLSVVADSMEYWLTGSAAAAGRREGLNFGLKGDDLKQFMDQIAGSTQSRYNKEARPLLLNNLALRSVAPFQTYSFELYRYVKTLLGKPGGIPLSKSARVNQAVMLLAGMYVYNQYTEATIGRTLNTPGSAIPIVGRAVDEVVKKGKKAVGFNSPNDYGGGRSPIAPQQDIVDFFSAVDSFVNKGNIQPLRKQLTRWGMGFSGVGGASTLNRFIDGMIADVQGYQETRSGDVAFVVEGTSEKIKAPIFGPYGTRAGREYLKKASGQSEKSETDRKTDNLVRKHSKLKEKGNLTKIQSQIDKLTDEEFESYKQSLKDFKKAEEDAKSQDMIKEVLKVRALKEDDKTDEAQDIINGLSDEEFGLFQDAVKEVNKKSFAEVIPEKDIVEFVWDYAKGLALDPITAFQTMFTDEELNYIAGDAVVIRRLSFKESERIKRDGGAEVGSSLRLDHFIPLQLGGDNGKDNLNLVEYNVWKDYTPVENHLGKLLRDGKIKEKEARNTITKFKQGQMTREEVFAIN